MFEMLSILIIYSRAELNDKLLSKLVFIMRLCNIVMFDTYCYTEGMQMTIGEYRFMLEKLITVVSQALSVKRAYLHDIYKACEAKLIPLGLSGGIGGKDKITQEEFMKIMNGVFREVAKDIDALSHKVLHFSSQVKNTHLPDYLQPGHLLLGQYLIQSVIPYSYIDEHKLLQQDSVFPGAGRGKAGGERTASAMSVSMSS